MSSVILPPEPFPGSGATLARISVDQYHKMIEAGAFADGDRIELLEGYLIEKMTKNPPHRFALGELDDLLRNCVPTGWHVANQEAITLDNSEPEPDLAVVRGPRRDDRKRHPYPPDIALVVDIADHSLATNRNKAETYARNELVIYWIVNLANRCVEVYESPGQDETGFRYASVRAYREGESLPLVIDGQTVGEVNVADILP